jgi:class 3 adenylate cyclase/CHASE2 domain-containing sensor protein
VDFSGWRMHRRYLLPGLISLALAGVCGLTAILTGFTGVFPALGGPNGYLYDLTLKFAEPWRRDIRTVPAVFVAVDEASLSTPPLSALPRALFQPVWARLIDGALDAGAQRIAFDIVFAYAGGDFRAGSYTLPDYDKSLIDSLSRHRERVIIGRFPGTPPAPRFVEAVGNSRVGILDLQVEEDGKTRSTAPLARLPEGRIAVGFAALGAGLNVRQAASLERIFITPNAPLTEIPTYSLATLLECLASPDGIARVREALAGSIVVVGTAVPGEDDHLGPTRFMRPAISSPPADRCAPHPGLIQRSQTEAVPGALLQVGAIQSAASPRPATLANTWLRFTAAVLLALIFAAGAFKDETALTVAEHAVTTWSGIATQLARTFFVGLAGPTLIGGIGSVAAFVAADLWLPMGYPIIATNVMFGVIVSVRTVRHRTLFQNLYRIAGRYLPPARLVVLAREGFADPPEGQEREVSILLVDLIGFTTFSNTPGRTASEVVRTANQYFTLMQSAIDRHGGCSDKFLGDAVLAFWNGLSDEPAHARKALLAACEIIEAVKSAAFEHRLGVRAVVCTGTVYVGDLGAHHRSNFTIIGPAVNETFRLERVPDLYGLRLMVAATTAESIMAGQIGESAAPDIVGGALIRVDDVELKGFSGSRSVWAFVPGDDPGRAAFEAGRKALDQQKLHEGLAHLSNVDSGLLQNAAAVVSARYRSAAASSL